MTRRSIVICRLLSLLAVGAGVAFSSGAAYAQGAETNSTFTEQRNDTGAAVVFSDDLMKGGGAGATPQIIPGRRSAVRMLLVRPRYNFVPEMLKSVENI